MVQEPGWTLTGQTKHSRRAGCPTSRGTPRRRAGASSASGRRRSTATGPRWRRRRRSRAPTSGGGTLAAPAFCRALRISAASGLELGPAGTTSEPALEGGLALNALPEVAEVRWAYREAAEPAQSGVGVAIGEDGSGTAQLQGQWLAASRAVSAATQEGGAASLSEVTLTSGSHSRTLAQLVEGAPG